MTERVDPKKLIKGGLHDWEVVIGMEIHAQVTSRSKLFSGAATAFGAEPNDHVSLVDAAMPGMLPVINEECVAQAVRTGLGLKAKVNLRSVFDRKNYFYPDLPQGYQISQYKDPIVGEGEVLVDLPDGASITVGIERLHLEQDAGKSLHDQDPTKSFVDLNRSGVALMEIVSRPDLRSSEEAKAYVTKLRTILRYLGTCDGDMEKGNLRADVNVSVRRPARGSAPAARSRTSTRSASSARRSKSRRGARSRSWRMAARSIRRPACSIRARARPARCAPRKRRTITATSPTRTCCRSNSIRPMSMPWRPGCRSCRTPRRRASSRITACRPTMRGVLVAERPSADYFEAVARGRDGKAAANWVINELFGRLNKEGRSIEDTPVSAEQLGGIVDLIGEGVISGKIAKDLFEIVWSEGGDPRDIVETRGMKQVTDTGAIEAAVDEIIAKNPDKVEQARAKPTLLGWFVGQTMKATGGKANPAAVNALLKEKLGIE